jgi:hypothetical protein
MTSKFKKINSNNTFSKRRHGIFGDNHSHADACNSLEWLLTAQLTVGLPSKPNTTGMNLN